MATPNVLPSRGPSSAPAQTAPKLTLAAISTKGNRLPNRYILHALEGWGKTSLAAQFPKPVFLQSRGETGLETLIDAGQLPETAHFPEAMTWADLMAALNLLTVEDHGYKTLVIDTLNGVERLCHEHVCARDFDGDWTDKGFLGYMRGYELALADWREFLDRLDRLRERKGMLVIALCHTKVATFKNPDGPDYDRFQPDMHAKTWSLSHKWADVVFFGNFETVVINAKGKEEQNISKRGKGAGGTRRVLLTQRAASYDAKNRLGLPECLDMGSSPQDAYRALIEAAREARTNGKENGNAN